MPKSKYPVSIDTSAELPPVRDNITEISSDIINSLRSAIFNIEKTLGINPQGSIGYTVAERLNRSLDYSGNLKSEATASFLTGPIIDANISDYAAILESKLKLNYPTELLQDEISILNNTYEVLVEQLDALSYQLALHLNKDNKSAHYAKNIIVEDESIISSDIATMDLSSGSAQSIISNIYSKHINYSGLNIGVDNNSHRSDQIYFDNDGIELLIPSNNVQDAIIDLTNINNDGLENTLINLASNGKIRSGKIIDGYLNSDYGKEIISSIDVTYTLSNTSTTNFLLTTPYLTTEISEFDILVLSGSAYDSDNIAYQIYGFDKNIDEEITNIKVYGGPKNQASSNIKISVYKNPYIDYNIAGLSSTVRPRYNKTNTPDVQILNPDSATIISIDISPEKITSSAHKFKLSIDGGDDITIDTYNSDISTQSLDSIIQKINDQAVDQHLNFLAYSVKTSNCYQLAISHNIPNFNGDIIERSLKVSNADSDDGLELLGLSLYNDISAYGNTNNSVFINGKLLNGLGVVKTFNYSDIQILTGLQLQSYAEDFNTYGIRIGDIVCITGSTVSTDDGSYRISDVTNSLITLDLGTNQFEGVLTESSSVIIIRNSAYIGELTFEEISSSVGGILFDTFLSENKDISFKKRLEIDGVLSDSGFYATISDISKNFITLGESATLSINTTGYATLTGPDLSPGIAVYVGVSGKYIIKDSSGLSFVILDVNSTTLPSSTLSITLYGFNEISKNNYHLSRGIFATDLGRILGQSNDPGIPVLTNKLNSGTVDSNIIGNQFIEKYIEGPRNDLRGCGIISGCEIVSADYFTGVNPYQEIDISAGVYVVNGIRKEFNGIEAYRIYESGNIIVGFDKYGCLSASAYLDNPFDAGNDLSPYFQDEFTYLGEITNDGSNIDEIFDLRLFIDHLDYKILSNIIVSNDLRFGHFTDIYKALKYGKKIYKQFKDLQTISVLIQNGTYEIDQTIDIDFDVSISGSGPDTILTRSDSFSEGTALTGDNVDMNTSIFLIGGRSNTSGTGIVNGVILKNFTYTTNINIENVGCAIAIAQPIEKDSVGISRKATYRVENVNFLGPSTIDGSPSDPNKIGDYAIILGQQNPNTLATLDNVIIGNLIVSNCYFNRMGLEIGCIKALESSLNTVRCIVISNSIIEVGSPNLNDNSWVVFEYPTSTVVSDIVEIGNVRRN